VRRALRPFLVALGVPAGLVALVLVAWAVDLKAHDGQVVRRVTLAGRPIGRLSEAALAKVVAGVATDLPGESVRVSAPGGGFTTEAKALGLGVDPRATTRAALRVGREGSVVTRVVDWAKSFRFERRAPVRVVVDSSAVWATVAARDPGPRQPPIEPVVAYKGREGFVAVAGKPGNGIDPADVVDALPKAATDGHTITVRVDRGDVPPRYPTADAERLAGELQVELSSPLAVTAGGVKATVPVATLRSWVTSEAGDHGLRPVVEGKRALADLAKLLATAGDPAEETTFNVNGGSVEFAVGKSGTKCCAEGAVAAVSGALLGGGKSSSPVDLPLTERPPRITAELAAKLNIAEPVGAFTTKHAAGEPRVHNIHRIADLVRGSVILPGETFSVNTTVGKRTVEKGFVLAPVIENGLHAEDVGGGISQFATTLFNASFFAGLDFGEYQSHSLRIGRYPYGREATMGYPHPDLEIENKTPNGVLVWPTYTDTTITVTLYSTRTMDSQQTGQSEAPRGACTRVTTERTRTWLADGHQEVDKVFATYRPSEGVAC
jgi:vancomycin resistance protein YoaR